VILCQDLVPADLKKERRCEINKREVKGVNQMGGVNREGPSTKKSLPPNRTRKPKTGQ